MPRRRSGRIPPVPLPARPSRFRRRLHPSRTSWLPTCRRGPCRLSKAAIEDRVEAEFRIHPLQAHALADQRPTQRARGTSLERVLPETIVPCRLRRKTPRCSPRWITTDHRPLSRSPGFLACVSDSSRATRRRRSTTRSASSLRRSKEGANVLLRRREASSRRASSSVASARAAASETARQAADRSERGRFEAPRHVRPAARCPPTAAAAPRQSARPRPRRCPPSPFPKPTVRSERERGGASSDRDSGGLSGLLRRRGAGDKKREARGLPFSIS
jgi:hypothetical protein